MSGNYCTVKSSGNDSMYVETLLIVLPHMTNLIDIYWGFHSLEKYKEPNKTVITSSYC